MDKKKAQNIIEETKLNDLLQKDTLIEEEVSDFEPNNIIAGFDCRETFEVLPNGNIKRVVEFEALREDSKEYLPEEHKEKLRKLEEQQNEIIELDFATAVRVATIQNEEKQQQAIKELYQQIKESKRKAKEETLIDLIIKGEVEPKGNTIVINNNGNYVVDKNSKISNCSPNANLQNSNVNNADFKSAYEENKKRASSSNKAYVRKKDSVDAYYDNQDAELWENAKLREMGIPIDYSFATEYQINAYSKMVSSMSSVLGFWLMDFSNGILPAFVDVNNPVATFLFWAGVSGYVISSYMGKTQNLSYRKSIYILQQAYLDKRTRITPDEIKEVVGYEKVNLPDKYALACMTTEEREKILQNAKNPYELTMKQKQKRIKKALNNYFKYGDFVVDKEKNNSGNEK